MVGHRAGRPSGIVGRVRVRIEAGRFCVILYCAADLLWATRIKATAESLGIAARPCRDTAMVAARLADSDVRGVIVDLEAGAAMEVIGALRGGGSAGGGGGTGGRRIPI